MYIFRIWFTHAFPWSLIRHISKDISVVTVAEDLCKQLYIYRTTNKGVILEDLSQSGICTSKFDVWILYVRSVFSQEICNSIFTFLKRLKFVQHFIITQKTVLSKDTQGFGRDIATF